MKSYNDIGDSFLMSERNIFEGLGLFLKPYKLMIKI